MAAELWSPGEEAAVAASAAVAVAAFAFANSAFAAAFASSSAASASAHSARSTSLKIVPSMRPTVGKQRQENLPPSAEQHPSARRVLAARSRYHE